MSDDGKLKRLLEVGAELAAVIDNIPAAGPSDADYMAEVSNVRQRWDLAVSECAPADPDRPADYLEEWGSR